MAESLNSGSRVMRASPSNVTPLSRPTEPSSKAKFISIGRGDVGAALGVHGRIAELRQPGHARIPIERHAVEPPHGAIVEGEVHLHRPRGCRCGSGSTWPNR